MQLRPSASRKKTASVTTGPNNFGQGEIDSDSSAGFEKGGAFKESVGGGQAVGQGSGASTRCCGGRREAPDAAVNDVGGVTAVTAEAGELDKNAGRGLNCKEDKRYRLKIV
eukprot:EG_transcript_43233